MNHEVRQLVITFLLVVGTFSSLWLGVIVTSADMRVRVTCYERGVQSLPQGVDQTLLQTQSKAYRDCLAKK